MKISIITVVFNAKKDLKKTLNSIRDQIYEDIELVIIDGASTDGTLDILEANKDIIEIIRSEPDDGLYYAMNKGKDLANGDFALFMNAGDVFTDNQSLSNIAKSMTNMNTFYYGNTVIYFGDTFKIAPETHHQSVFFPKVFYQNEDYDSIKYKITAEGDYIFRAQDQHPSKHIDVDIIYSRIDGFRVHRYSTIAGSKQIYQEVIALMKQHSKAVPLSFKVTYPIKSLMKFFAFKIGGLPLVAKMLLRSYKKSERQYTLMDKID